MTKYKQYFEKMVEENKQLFDEFKAVHAKYDLDDGANQDEFNKLGEKVLDVIHEWENRLCKTSEGAGFGSFTTNLAAKFQEEVKKSFPLFDHIGIVATKEPTFSLKKIKL